MADTSQPNRVVLHIDADTTGAEQKIARVEQILNNAERSERSKVMSVAALYKQQGMETSAAMQKAWQQVRTSAQSAAAPVQQQTTFFERLRIKAGDVIARMRQFGTEAQTSSTRARAGFSLLNTTASALSATLTSLFAVTRILAWAKACVTASTDTENALRGLSSVLNGQGRSFTDAQRFIEDYIADGLVPLEQAVTSYKNLAARGYDDTQIRRVMVALKDSAAYGRQASYTLGDAVMSATEGLKNENSVLVDNAGVTKNVAKMWDDYAKSIGTTANRLTQQQRIQAEVNGILTETRYQTGDAARVAGTFSGQVAQLSANVKAFHAVAGDFLKTALVPAVSWLNRGFQAATLFLRTIGEALGITTDTAQFASDIGQAAANTDSLTDAINAAKNAQDRLLAASFDEFNVIGTQEDEGAQDTTAAVPVPDLSGIAADTVQVSDDLGELNDKVQAFAQTWLSGWESIKSGWSDWNTFWEGVGGKVYDFTQDWIEYWEDIGEKAYDFTSEFPENWRIGIDEIERYWKLGFKNLTADWVSFFVKTGGDVYDFTSEFPENWRIGIDEVERYWKLGFKNLTADWVDFLVKTGTTVYGFTQEQSENWRIGFAEIRKNWKLGFIKLGVDWNSFQKEKGAAVFSFLSDVGQNWSISWAVIRKDWKNGFSYLRSKASEKWDTVADAVKAPFRGIADWFRSTFSRAWQNVLDVFSRGGSVFQGIEAGISTVFKETVNGLIDGLNNTLTLPFWNIKEALRVLREWEFAGMNPFYWMPDIDLPTIPRLARGGIVSQPTLALVGDNPNARTDPEIVSPLSKLRAMLPEQSDPVIAEKLDTLIRLLELVLTAVQDRDSAQLGDKEIYAAAMRGKRRYDRMKGAY